MPSSTAWRWMPSPISARPTSPTLDLYCGRVAGAVGHLSVHVFGDASDGRASGRRCARPRVAAHQYPARPRRGCAARPALSAARGARAARHPRAASPAAVLRHPALPAACRDRRRDRARPFRRGASGDGGVLAPRDAAGGGDGRVLPRDAGGAAARRGWRDPTARVSLSKARQIVAGAAPRPDMSARGSGSCRRRRPGRPGRRGARWRERGGAVVLYEAASMPAAAAAPISIAELGCTHRQRQPPAARRQSRRARLSRHDRRARHASTGRASRRFPFVDLASGERWTLRPNAGPVPWWVLRRARRVPGTPCARLSRGAAAALRRAEDDTVAAAARPRRRRSIRRLWAAARGRGAEHRRRGGLGAAVLAASCARPWAAAARPAGR